VFIFVGRLEIAAMVGALEAVSKMVLCRRYVEVYVSVSPEECARRDTTEMYRRAKEGEIQNFTGVSDPYEEPEKADIVVDNERQGVDESVAFIMKALKKRL
jgi:adenylylsulfate kinase